jgi:hypothetical protein
MSIVGNVPNDIVDLAEVELPSNAIERGNKNNLSLLSTEAKIMLKHYLKSSLLPLLLSIKLIFSYLCFYPLNTS